MVVFYNSKTTPTPKSRVNLPPLQSTQSHFWRALPRRFCAREHKKGDSKLLPTTRAIACQSTPKSLPKHAIARHSIPKHAIARHSIPKHAIARHSMPSRATAFQSTPSHSKACQSTPKSIPRHAIAFQSLPKQAKKHSQACHRAPKHAKKQAKTGGELFHEFGHG